jgi:hypothetical protein
MWIIALLLALVPIAVPATVVLVSVAGVDPELTPEEEKLVEAIAKSEWARALAAKMATTPEAQEMVARRLAVSLVKGIRRM